MLSEIGPCRKTGLYRTESRPLSIRVYKRSLWRSSELVGGHVYYLFLYSPNTIMKRFLSRDWSVLYYLPQRWSAEIKIAPLWTTQRAYVRLRSQIDRSTVTCIETLVRDSSKTLVCVVSDLLASGG